MLPKVQKEKGEFREERAEISDVELKAILLQKKLEQYNNQDD